MDVTAESGLAESNGRGLGVVAADLDDDNRIDLYVANDGTANYLFRNQGGFRFEETALEAGVAGSASGGYQAGMGVACGDLDGDGRPDLLVTNFYGEGTTYYQNLGQGLFADRSAATGLGLATRYLLGFGIALADVANAGRLDVMIANGHVNDNRPYFPYAMPCRLYANRPDGRLVDVSKQAGDCWQVAASRPRPGGRRPRQRRPGRRRDPRPERAAGLLPQPERASRPLRDLPARGDEVQPRRRRRTGDGDGRGPSPGRPAAGRRQLPVGQRPSAAFRPGRPRPGRLRRGPLALGQGRPPSGPARRHGLPAPRGGSEAETAGRLLTRARSLWHLAPYGPLAPAVARSSSPQWARRSRLSACRASMAARIALEAGADVFLDDGRGDLEGDDVLDDHAGGRDGADVGAFVGGGLGGLGGHVDRRPARGQRADRLLGGADDDRLAVGRSALDTAGVVGRPAEAEAAIVGADGRARRRSGPSPSSPAGGRPRSPGRSRRP